MAVNVKMGVDTSGFKSNIQDMTQQLKSFDAQLKYAEATMKATGSAEQGMLTKTNALTGKLETQKRMIQQYTQQLERMRQNGIDPMSKEYQKLQTALLNTSASMVETEAALNNLDKSQEQAAESADQLVKSMNGIGQKISLGQVISGIGSITSGLEAAGKKAVDLGKKIWENITDAARFGDDTATSASILGMDVEEYQKYKKVFDTVADITVQEWAKAKQKVQKAINDPTDDQTSVLGLLGINTHEMSAGKFGAVQGAARDFEDVLWDIGETLKRKVESGELSMDLADTYANAIFGKSFANMKPLFDLGREGFAAALKEQDVVKEESVKKLATLNDKLVDLQGDFDTLKEEVLAGLAPALTKGAEAIDSMLSRLIEYAQSPAGQEMLEKLGTAVSGLFDDLDKIDPEQVVKGFVGAFEKVVGGFEWVLENKDTVIGALKYIIEGWGLLKITGGALHVWELIQGILGLSDGASTAAAAGTAAGASWGAAFAEAVAAAAPWLVGIYTLLKPSQTGNNDLADANGNMTAEGWSDFLIQRQRYSESGEGGRWADLIAEAGEIVEAASMLWDDKNGIQALADYAISGDKEKLAANLQALGYVLKTANEDLLPELQGTGTAYTFEGDRSGREVLHRDRRTGELILPAEPVVEEGAADDVAQQVGPVDLPAFLTFHGWTPGGAPSIPYFGDERGYANGLPYVPRDGLYLLHKGETVTPERGVGSRSFSSNLYVENMNMNNGMDADGLAARMSAAQQRMLSGYGQ